MGTPDFAVPSLQALINEGFNMVGVYSQPPRPAGRGKKLTPSPIHKLAEQNNIPVFTPEKFTPEAIAELTSLAPDFICVAAYGLILPQKVLDIAPCLNVHPSALPRWRGAAPLQHTILAGDPFTHMCIMQMEAGLDTGPVYLREQHDVGLNETAGELHDRMAQIGGESLVTVLKNWPMESTAQSEQDITYASKITPDMRPTDFNKPAWDVHNHIRGLSPWPGATATHGETTLKLLKSEVTTEINGTIGTVMDTQNGIVIACATGAIRITELQRPGKKPQPAKEFLKGFDINIGSAFNA